MRTGRIVSLISVLLVLSACGGGSDESNPSASAPAGSDGGDQNASSEGEDGDDEPAVEVVDFGFGESDSSVQGMVILTTEDEAAVGEFATVTVNFLDADGQIIATEEQVETFTWVGQDLVLPVSLYDPGATVVSMEPSVSLSDYGDPAPDVAPLPVLEATEIQEPSPGRYTASFAFTNETDSDLEDLRVGVVCYDEAMEIIGGESTYPSVAPAGNTIRIDAEYLTVSGTPASCDAYMNYGYMP